MVIIHVYLIKPHYLSQSATQVQKCTHMHMAFSHFLCSGLLAVTDSVKEFSHTVLTFAV